MKKISLVFAVSDNDYDEIREELYLHHPKEVAEILCDVCCESKIKIEDIEY